MRHTRHPTAELTMPRLSYLDNLKVVLIAAIIAIHAVLGYAAFMDLWSYTSLREVTLSPVVETVLTAAVSPLGLPANGCSASVCRSPFTSASCSRR
jgi:hypothetical protein